MVPRGLETRADLHDHAVGFYADDAEVVAGIAAYAAEGLTRRERVLAVVTPEHRTAVDDALADLGLDPARARHAGSYVTLEAAHTLSTFLVDGSPDRDGFADTVGRLVCAAGEDGTPVRAFGEMVALLWDRGDVVAALELESLWNEYAQADRLSLLCGYSTAALDGAALGDIGRVCDLHSVVHAPSSYTSAASARNRRDETGADRSEIFLPVPEAVPTARRFVREVLAAWGAHEVAEDAALVTSELATNAILHGRSPFRASVSRSSGVVRIAIEDLGPAWPAHRAATSHDLDGRGMAIVEALADLSGCEAVPGAKIAWAEFTRAASSGLASPA